MFSLIRCASLLKDQQTTLTLLYNGSLTRYVSTKKAVTQTKATEVKKTGTTPKKPQTLAQPKPVQTEAKPITHSSQIPVILGFIKATVKIRRPQDWYKVKKSDIDKPGVFDLFSNIHAIAKADQPHFPFLWYKFQDVSEEYLKSYFSKTTQQKEYLTSLANEYEINEKYIYLLKKQFLTLDNAGSYLLQLYGDSMYNMISKLYPKFDKYDLFCNFPDWNIEEKEVQEHYIKFLEKELNLVELDNIAEKLSERRLAAVNKKLGGNAKELSFEYVITMLADKKIIPGLKILLIKNLVQKSLETVFPHENIIQNEREIFKGSFVVDFYVPARKFAIDILAKGVSRDKAKEAYCNKHGITLCTQFSNVSDTHESVNRIIKDLKERVDNMEREQAAKKSKTTKTITTAKTKAVAKEETKPTKTPTTTAKEEAKKTKAKEEPQKPTPSKKSKQTTTKEEISEEKEEETTTGKIEAVAVISKEDVMIPAIWDETTDMRGDYIFEIPKNSVPIFWDGRSLRWRNGKEIKIIPYRKLSGLPKSEPLIGYLTFPNIEIRELVQGQELAWAHAKFHILDAPMAGGTYIERYQRLKALSANKYKDQFLNYDKYKTFSDSTKFISHCKTLDQLGMGVIMFDPKGDYKAGFSTYVKTYGMPEEAYLKVAKAITDPKTGRKYLRCKQGNGKICEVNLPGEYKKLVWTTSDIIVISYTGRSIDGRYLEPVFCGIRPDIDWKDVVQEES